MTKMVCMVPFPKGASLARRTGEEGVDLIADPDGCAFVAHFGRALAALRLTLLMTGFVALGALLRPMFWPALRTTLARRTFGPMLGAMLARRTFRVLFARRPLGCGNRRRFCRLGTRLAMFARLATRATRPLGAATAAFASTTTTAATAATAAVGRLEALAFQAGDLDAGAGSADQLLDRLHDTALGGRRQGDGMCNRAGAAGTADAMNGILRRGRHVEIEDV